MIEFRQTLLPVPVRPAISRCGSVARSTTSGLPATSLPRKSGILHLLRPCRWPPRSLRAAGRAAAARWALRCRRCSCRESARRCARWARAGRSPDRRPGSVIFDSRRPASSSTSYCAMTGPVSISTTLTLKPKFGERLFQNLGLAADFLLVLVEAHIVRRQQQVERRQLVVGVEGVSLAAASSSSMISSRSLFCLFLAFLSVGERIERADTSTASSSSTASSASISAASSHGNSGFHHREVLHGPGSPSAAARGLLHRIRPLHLLFPHRVAWHSLAACGPATAPS